MYHDFYGLTQAPFNITSNADLFFESASHREALATLCYGIEQRKGLILITGEVGTGKTTLCKALLNRVSSRVKTSLILNPYFSQVQLLEAIVDDFGLTPVKKNRLDILRQLNRFLVDIRMDDGNAVLIIDEAQNLSAAQLEQVRLLTNLETQDEKLLQIMLVGQPELVEKLSEYKLRQIKQRIFVRCTLAALNEEEVTQYITFRLKKAGAEGVSITPQGYRLIYEFSGGIPRLINMLCDRLLLFGFVKEKKDFDAGIISECISELE